MATPRSGALRVVAAPRLEPLFARLAETLAAEPLDPLAKETVVVAQNRGLRAWVEQALARRFGCAASLDVRAPRAFATDLARAIESRKPDAEAAEGERHPFDAAPLAWRLAAFLDRLPEVADPARGADVYAPLRAYLDRTGGATMPLARRLAQLFDDYQVYRPDVLAAWARGEGGPPDFPHGAWQADLWRHLAGGATALDRAASALEVVEALEANDRRLVARLPERVSVFGALVFPPLYYRVLAAAA
ncbi:MAG TPA: exodeoxyribonuclease V subunit gamma, partial [Anaeromyxobacteraceae bacterium]|nr:exodeoxyribonuclease V subunit gamma [Anaeromyxobacteraceae bacterium]